MFVWSGFVRTGLSFGGALFTIPFLLLIDDRPLVYLPLIAIQLLFFSALTFLQTYLKQAKHNRKSPFNNIAWPYLKYILAIIIIPKCIGVLGLLTLPDHVMSIIIFSIVSLYALTYIINKPLAPRHPVIEICFLVLGGYISGTSLIGAPLIVAVAARHITPNQLRDTLFVLWFILVSIKLAFFVYTQVDLHLVNHFWLIPCALIGHTLGLKVHDYLLQNQNIVFYRVIGLALFTASSVGLYQAILS